MLSTNPMVNSPCHVPTTPTPPENQVAEVKDAPPMVETDAGLIKKVLSTKTLGLVKAWEQSEKTKVENKANKKLSNIGAWELSEQASIEARQKKYEQKLERKKAEFLEKMQNKIAEIHKAAEEKRAMVEAAKKEECVKVEEEAEKFREAGYTPKKILSCFNC